MVVSTTVQGVPGPSRSPTPPAGDTSTPGSSLGRYAPRSVLTRSSSLPDLVLRWADHDDGMADVWLPARGFGTAPAPAPLLYALHGGFWGSEFDRRHLRPLARALCDQGWVVVVPEYARVAGRHMAAGLAAPWPLVVDDLRMLRHRVPQLLAEVAPGRITDHRPVLVGHSAGGQLALWWALDQTADTEGADAGTGVAGPPRHVLGLAPVADMTRARAEHLGDGAVEALLGSNPCAGLVEAADPAARMRAGEWPAECTIIVLHGADDHAVPLVHSTDLGAELSALDVRPLPAVEHFALIDPLSSAWPYVLAALPPAI